MEKERANGNNWCVGRCVIHNFFQNRGLSGPCVSGRLAVGHENGVLFHVVVVTVMARVAELPAEERNKQHAVQDPSCDSVHSEVVGERVVAAVVSQDPKAGEEKTCDEAVKSPQGASYDQRCL